MAGFNKVVGSYDDALAGLKDGMTVMVGYTSGSTGQPKTFPKRWRSVNGSNSRNAGEIRAAIGGNPQTVWLLATVPPQHMYGMELSILLPLSGDMAVHAGRPLFPADIASALAELPRPRVLVSTPVHLRAIVDSPQAFPEVDAIVSATAPLDQPRIYFGPVIAGAPEDYAIVGKNGDVDREYERAAEDFLREELEFVLVHDWHEARQGVDFLLADLQDGKFYRNFEEIHFHTDDDSVEMRL